MTEAVTELVAIGAAMACNCEPCFKAHYDRARRLGVSSDDMRKAVNTALCVKAAPHRKLVETSERYLTSMAPAVDDTGTCSKAPQSCGCSE
jgi:AhpD family alkylhydroperoxidase